MKIIVAGSRGFNDYDIVSNRLLKYFKENRISSSDMSDIEIISGTARGADRLGERFALEHGCKLTRMPADWERYGKRAGMIRNKEMARYAHQKYGGVLFAFWDGQSRGTKAMIDIAYKLGMEIIVVRTDQL